MSDFKERVIKEKNKLSKKLEKLRAFIGTEAFNELDDADSSLLFTQEIAMTSYLQILEKRIIRFKNL